jgi:GNAT superfamily N-acetyltransferase
MNINIKNITNNQKDLEILNNFICSNKHDNFRYFEKRPLSIIQNHIYTSLYLVDNKLVGYGHLDKENDTIWLGILVSENFRGLKIGSFIMDDLIKQHTGRITLSVDIQNTKAISLYKNKGFNIFETRKNNLIMKNK